MPITQSRVIALINAALDAFQAANSLASLHNHPRGTGFKRFNETWHTIEQEYRHFSANAARNARTAEHQRKVREQQRVDGTISPRPRRKHIPVSMYETELLADPSAIISSHAHTYQVASTVAPLLTSEDRIKEAEFQTSYEYFKVRGERQEETIPCARCKSTEPFCIMDLNTICPGNRLREGTLEYEEYAQRLRELKAERLRSEWIISEEEVEYDPSERIIARRATDEEIAALNQDPTNPTKHD